jgi:predicted phage-related endonuclease
MFAAKEWEEGIPGAYYVQVQHQLMVTGFQYADVCLLQHGIYDLKIIPIERNDEFIERLLEAEVLFWEKFVTKRAEPPLLSRELQLKESNGNSIEADADICKVLEVYREQRKCLEALEGDIKQSEEKIKQYIGENDILTVGGKKAASWKSYSNRRFSNKLFKEEHPDMYEQYRIASPTRKFLLTKPKKSK